MFYNLQMTQQFFDMKKMNSVWTQRLKKILMETEHYMKKTG